MQTTVGLLSLINLVTFLWVMIWTIYSLSKITSTNMLGFLLFGFFVFNAIPLLLDITLGVPDYTKQPGFAIATQNMPTNLLYCVYMAFIPPFWYIVYYSPSLIKRMDIDNNIDAVILKFVAEHNQRFILFIYLLLFSPFIMLILSPDPTVYLKLGWIEWYNRMYLSPEVVRFGRWLARACLISILASSALLLMVKRINIIFIIFLAIIVYINFVMVSMRHALVYAIVSWTHAFWLRGYLRGAKLFIASFVILIIFSIFNQYFIETYRYRVGVSTPAPVFQDLYTRYRVDFGRDDVVKMTLYSQLYPNNMRILEYPGQSILPALLVFIPRSYWKDKPYAYADYFTAAMLNTDISYIIRNLGKGYMTTSWLEEAIANFGLLGLFIGPLVPALILRTGSSRGQFGKVLSVVVSIFFLAVHLPAFNLIFALYLIVIFIRL